MGLLDRLRKTARREPEPAAPEAARDAPWDREGILASLRAFVAAHSDTGLAPGQIDPAAGLLEEAILDSVGGLEFLGYIEETWGVSIEESELVGRLHCLDRIVDHLRDHVAPPA